MRWSSRGPSRAAALGAAALSMALAAVSCGGSPTQPSPVDALSISCPVAQAAQSLDGGPVIVNFPNPTVSGGQGVLSTTCSPTSGSRFAVGTSNVTCTAQDAKKQTASCSFQVTVSRVPRLAATRFVAFGDSMTEGFVQQCRTTTLTGRAAILADLQYFRELRPPGYSAVSYPVKLQAMLASRYAGQAITVINEGNGGEKAAEGALALPAVLNADTPQALLLLEGINDIHAGTPTQASAIPTVISSLRSMVQEGKRRGMTVFLATLLPERKGSCRSFDFDDGVEDVVPTNSQIRSLATSENVPLVDMYPAFTGSLDTLLGPDGLHPSEAGYQKMADLFYAAIQQRLEQ
ncbi:MAG: HYR domain-containing protein [Acidobacteria bacterium]|nr:HYR domain-containing protein [Acidobacteriota bacterium]